MFSGSTHRRDTKSDQRHRSVSLNCSASQPRHLVNRTSTQTGKARCEILSSRRHHSTKASTALLPYLFTMIHSAATFLAILAVASALSRSAVLKPFSEGNAFKVIAGLNNFDASIVKNVVSAACSGGASHVDLACDPSLVRLAKSISSEMPICVSSIKPIDFVAAVAAGADMIEIGNFDGFYEQGLKFTAEDVIAMTIETRSLLPNIPLSVTVPHTLSLSEQVALAIRLEECGADIIQTEGKMGVNPSSMGVQEMIEKAAPTLAAGDI